MERKIILQNAITKSLDSELAFTEMKENFNRTEQFCYLDSYPSAVRP